MIPPPLPSRCALVFYSPLGIKSSKTSIILLWEATQQNFEQTEPGNASCSAKENDGVALENDTLQAGNGKMQMQNQKVFENVGKNDGETASKCLLISFKSSCWPEGIYMCYK